MAAPSKHSTRNTPPKIEGYFCVGVITGAHGIKGEVIIKPFTEEATDMNQYGALITQKNEPIRIKKLRPTNKGVIAGVDGVQYRDESEKMRGTYLYASDKHLPDTEDDNAYVDELIGMNVIREDESAIGKIVNVFDNGAQYVVEICVEGKEDLLLLPFTEDVVLTVAEENITVSEMVDDFLAL